MEDTPMTETEAAIVRAMNKVDHPEKTLTWKWLLAAEWQTGGY